MEVDAAGYWMWRRHGDNVSRDGAPVRDSAFSALVFSLSWAVYLTFTKLVLSAGADAFAVGIQATIIGALCLGSYGLLFRKFRRVDWLVVRRILVVAALYDLSIFTGFYGLGLSTLVNYGFLIKTTVVFTVFLSAAFLGEGLSARKLLLVIILLSGAFLLSTRGESLVPMRGDLFIVFTAFVLSLGNVLSKPIVRSLDPFNFAFIRILAGAVIFIPVSFFIGTAPLAVTAPALTFAAGFFLALTAFLLYRTMRLTAVSYMSMFSTLTPVFASVLAFFALGETMGLFQIVGGALILAAVFFLPEK